MPLRYKAYVSIHIMLNGTCVVKSRFGAYSSTKAKTKHQDATRCYFVPAGG